MLHGIKLDNFTRFQLRNSGFLNHAEPTVGMSISYNEQRMLEKIVPMQGIRYQKLAFSDIFDDVETLCGSDVFEQGGVENADGNGEGKRTGSSHSAVVGSALALARACTAFMMRLGR